MSEVERVALVQAYLAAFDKRDLEACLAYFTEDAAIEFQDGRFLGADGVREWHEERFLADLRLIEVEDIRLEAGDKVVVDAVVSSNTLRVWRMDNLAGTVTFLFQGDKIQAASFGLRMYNEGLWHV